MVKILVVNHPPSEEFSCFKYLDGVRFVNLEDCCRALGMPNVNPSQLYLRELDAALICQLYVDKYIKLFNPEMVIYNSLCNWITKHKIKTVTVIADNYIKCDVFAPFQDAISHYRFKYIYPYIQVRSAKNSDITLAPSREVAEDYQKFGIEIKTLRFGVDTGKFFPIDDKIALREKYGIDKTPIGLWIGEFNPGHGYHLIQQLVKENRDIHWIIAFKSNTGSYKPKLKNVKLVQASEDKLQELYNLADFYVSTSPVEGFGINVLRAMACDVPVIAMDTGIIKELHEERDGDIIPTAFGFVCRKWEIETLRNALEEMKFYLKKGGYRFAPRAVIEENELTVEDFEERIKGIIL